MSRRLLRVVSSSDEEEVEQEQRQPPAPPLQDHHQDDAIIDDVETNFQTVTLNSSTLTPNTRDSATTADTSGNGRRAPEPVPIDISDEVEETIYNGESTNSSRSDGAGYFEVSDSPVNGVLEGLGLRLRREWLESCLRGLESSVPGFQGMDDSTKAKFCFQQFLGSDMNCCGAGVLPPNVHSLHLVDLKGPFVLQVDEIVNISCPLRGRYQKAAPGAKRCLKLSMTDGVQRVFGMEYRAVKYLEVLAPAGLKVAVCNVNIRHGLFMLVPEVLQVLGGAVEELETARQRLVNEVNKPPRGKRNRTGVSPPLATRATLAAWPRHSGSNPQHISQATSVNTAPLQATGQGTTVNIQSNDMRGQTYATESRISADPGLSSHQLQEHDEGLTHVDAPVTRPLEAAGTETVFGRINASSREDTGAHVNRSNTEPRTLPAVHPADPVTIPRHIDEPMTEAVTSPMVTGQAATSGLPRNSILIEHVTSPGSRDIDSDAVEIAMADEFEHQFILSRVSEIPFTYLASLSAKLVAIEDETATIRGKIKCFMTGVKRFLYRQRTTYELQAYVDDGSLISEILIDHNVVQKGIGYSPQEVTTALASSDSKRVGDMKEMMKQFQMFLLNFEGTILVEMSKASPIPIAVEMSQGCPAGDTRLLLNRLLRSSGSAPQQLSHLNPIDLSP